MVIRSGSFLPEHPRNSSHSFCINSWKCLKHLSWRRCSIHAGITSVGSVKRIQMFTHDLGTMRNLLHFFCFVLQCFPALELLFCAEGSSLVTVLSIELHLCISECTAARLAFLRALNIAIDRNFSLDPFRVSVHHSNLLISFLLSSTWKVCKRLHLTSSPIATQLLSLISKSAGRLWERTLHHSTVSGELPYSEFLFLHIFHIFSKIQFFPFSHRLLASPPSMIFVQSCS